ncbi:hypothetical protein AQF52_5852 [Streptomyces venezuelae]|uniref:hypothetical protein n=1 Tax=Streptomyces gardneri TaxID=66892 RepID=UPI0006BDFB64|nr:hypothetical protein [Streptomyces gardneri]ALO11445.1 hypothetical protein AQF52_5852 [Streptomyces venezuelae]QPK48354.1 hypothetical protein H4W23_29410 [Streptomyces gardneri]WRK39820.1 hypothetical protein U0M97_29550 [Streptomyces venezuelae]CUM38021.1 hypothetical protein BN2537_5007 [Streptomyces venezuelae]
MSATKASPRRALSAAVRATVLASVLALTLAPALTSVAYGAECKPEDQACKDQEANEAEAKEIDEQQKKTQEAATKADKDIKDAGKKLEECPPGSAACMEKLAGKGSREEDGLREMTTTVSEYQPEPADNAAQAVESTCAAFPASLPQGSSDPGQSPFPASQLCALLGS